MPAVAWLYSSSAIAYFDQGGKDTPPYDGIHVQYASDSNFFAEVHEQLGDGAAVFNLPYLAFPEVPPRLQMGAYDQSIGYVFEPTLNWSFGFMRGRVARLSEGSRDSTRHSEWMRSIAAIGFTGIVVDGAGYTAEDRANQEFQIAELVGAPEMSADGRYSFFDLREFATGVRNELGDAGTKALAAETLALQAPPETRSRRTLDHPRRLIRQRSFRRFGGAVEGSGGH